MGNIKGWSKRVDVLGKYLVQNFGNDMTEDGDAIDMAIKLLNELQVHRKLAPKVEQPSDMLYEPCKRCANGAYRETSIMDNIQGVLHCDNCDHEVKRRPIVEE